MKPSRFLVRWNEPASPVASSCLEPPPSSFTRLFATRSSMLKKSFTMSQAKFAFRPGRTLPGLNANFAWDIVKDFFAIELLVANNRVQNEGGGSRHELATGLAGSFHLTKNLEGFIEWDAFYPTGGIGPAAPRHFAVGGLVYFISPNLAVDGRVGVGLNHSSNDFLVGFGFAVRR